ncbi:MAG: hypothetical protein ACI8S6_004626 [Myxococcota bacterium]|jgi:hypothetical protein
MNGLLLVAMLSMGCNYTRHIKNLSNTEFDHYYALRVFMSEEQKKTFLKLKTEEERNAFLESAGLWDKFYSYDDDERQEIIAGDVQVGWTKDKLYMAWGAPYDRARLVGRQATRSERLTYRFEEQEDGVILLWEEGSKTAYKAARLFVRELILDDDVVREINEETGNW